MALQPRTSQKAHSQPAFTLVEVLMVVSIIGVMALGIFPLFSGMSDSQRLNKTVSDLAGLMEQARAHAMAKNTYVYVGLVELNQHSENPLVMVDGGKLGVAIMFSKNGVRPTSMSPDELLPLSSLQQFEGVNLEPVDAIGNMERHTGSEVLNLAQANAIGFAAFNYQHPSGSQLHMQKVLEFDPRGLVRFKDQTNLAGWIEIPIQPANSNSKNVAAIQVDGVTGSVRIYRP